MIIRNPWISIILLILLGCTRSDGRSPTAFQILEVSEKPVGSRLSLHQTAAALHLTYTDLSALSLNLQVLVPSPHGSCPLSMGGRHYLDRISYTPETLPSVGEHLLLVEDGTEHLFYLDLEREDKTVLKWINESSESRWIDTLPFSGQLIAALSAGKGRIDLFLLSERTLYLHSLRGVEIESARPLLTPLSCRGPASTFEGGESSGFVVYDELSRHLYLLQGNDAGYEVQPVFEPGEVHDCALLEDGQLGILVYDPSSFQLTLLLSSSQSLPFQRTPVTLCQQTEAIHLDEHEGRIFFLFTERDPAGSRATPYSLCLLYPEDTGQKPRYRKLALVRSGRPIVTFRALRMESCLYVAFVQESLRIGFIDLRALFGE